MGKKPLYYVLDKDKNPISCDDMIKINDLLSNYKAKVVARTELNNGIIVSTVFLGIDHNFGEGPPILFETMVFNDVEASNEMERYTTWDEAEKGHKIMVKQLKKEINKRKEDNKSENDTKEKR